MSSEIWPPKRVICVGAVVLKDERVLLIRQAKGTSLEGQWSVPWGVVEDGEYPSKAALRETKEEAGVDAEIIGLLGVQNVSWETSISIIFLCRHVSGTPKSDGGIETDRAKYMSLEQIETFDEPIESWSGWIARRVLRGQHYIIPEAKSNPFQPHPAFL